MKSDTSLGIEQGLYLVTRIIDTFGWHLQLQQVNDEFLLQVQISSSTKKRNELCFFEPIKMSCLIP